MRVSIPKGYRAPIEKLMSQLQTDDPALAVTHVIGCWLASNGCPGAAIPSNSSSSHPAIVLDDDFTSALEVNLD